jgi:hypothetical protein
MAPTAEHEAQPGVLRRDEALFVRAMARVFNVSAPGPARVTVLSTDRAEIESCRDADVLDSSPDRAVIVVKVDDLFA